MLIANREIGGDSCFTVCEIGHNHQGSVAVAEKMIRTAAQCGADAVKLQKRTNEALYTQEFLNRSYESENAFGDTYGTHREFLEFGWSDYTHLQEVAEEVGVILFATAFDKLSVDFCVEMGFPAIKIASGDLTNTPLISHATQSGLPIFLSTGGGQLRDVDRAVSLIPREQLVLMQCTAMYPCFPAGTLILTERGYRPIEEIQEGTRVLTHEGRWQKVVTRSRRQALVRRVIAQGVPDLLVTDEHPFRTRERFYHHGNKDQPAGMRWLDPEWTPAEKLIEKKHYLAQVLPPVQIPKNSDPAYWWVVGRYLADGWQTNVRSVYICCRDDEADELQERIEATNFRWARHKEGGITRFRLGAKFFDEIKDFGRYAHGKRLSAEALALPKNLAASLLEGYLSGDGCDGGTTWLASTASKELALGLGLVAQRAWGVVAGVYKQVRSGVKYIKGRRVYPRAESYTVRIPKRAKDRQHGSVLDGTGWKRVYRSDALDVSLPVYNIQVEGDSSYVAENAVVHNCPFDKLDLLVIGTYKSKYPDVVVGASLHDNGIAMSMAAYTLGARVLEKHMTLRRDMKGTDHAFSLEPQGFAKMVRDLRRLEVALGDGEKRRHQEELPAITKMGKALFAARPLRAGHVLTKEDFAFLSPGTGLPPYMAEQLVGQILATDLNEEEPIEIRHLQRASA